LTHLEKLLNSPKNGNFNFYSIAENLIQKYQIKKEVDESVQFYDLTDIEFYYYGPNHKDEYVHPHFYTEPGQFRVHYSGVDITLGGDWGKQEVEIQNVLKKDKKYSDNNRTFDYDQIKEQIKDDVKYGGILLRGIKETGKDFSINGPWRVLCELFHLEGANLKLSIVEKEKESITIYLSKRSGLGDKQVDFKERLYRFSLKKL